MRTAGVVAIVAALIANHPGKLELAPTLKLVGSARGLARLSAGEDAAAVAASWVTAEAAWRRVRAKYLLY